MLGPKLKILLGFLIGVGVGIAVSYSMRPQYALIRPTRPAILSPFGDGHEWIVSNDIDFESTLANGTITHIVVPRGFVTDLASTPPSIWSIYPPFGKYLMASILHDYLYWMQTCVQAEADKIFYQTMRDAGVDQKTQTRFYFALQKFAKQAWEDNRRDRSAGFIRVIPDDILRSTPPVIGVNDSWSSIRAKLRERGVKEGPIPDAARIGAACSGLGKEIKVDTRLKSFF